MTTDLTKEADACGQCGPASPPAADGESSPVALDLPTETSLSVRPSGPRTRGGGSVGWSAVWKAASASFEVFQGPVEPGRGSRRLLSPRPGESCSITGTAEADIEDLFEGGFYVDLVTKSGVGKVTKSKMTAGGRLVKRVEAALGTTYSHYRPARYFLLNQKALLQTLTPDTLDRFEDLFKRLNGLVA